MQTKELKKILNIQRNELTEYFIYKKLSLTIKDKYHIEVLKKISEEELSHYEYFKKITGEEVKPYKLKIFIYVFLSRVAGLNFGLKLMESGEKSAQKTYEKMKETYPETGRILNEEKEHEIELISTINEERLKYVSSMVLGLNDALVELTGALVGFTLALQKTKLIGIVGLITGIAASMSMSASEFLASKHEETNKNPFKASIYTGTAYILTVAILVTPYFLFRNIFLCLSMAIVNAVFLIFLFSFYISIAKSLNFKKRFIEMTGISMGVAIINLFIGLIIRKLFGIEV